MSEMSLRQAARPLRVPAALLAVLASNKCNDISWLDTRRLHRWKAWTRTTLMPSAVLMTCLIPFTIRLRVCAASCQTLSASRFSTKPTRGRCERAFMLGTTKVERPTSVSIETHFPHVLIARATRKTRRSKCHISWWEKLVCRKLGAVWFPNHPPSMDAQAGGCSG